MSPRALAIAALLALAPTAAPAQEAVLLRLGGTPGRSVRSRLVVDTWMHGLPGVSAGSDTTLPTMHLELFVTQTLDALAGDTLAFTTAIDSGRADSPAAPEASAMLQASLGSSWGRSSYRVDRRGELVHADSADAAAAEGGSVAASVRQLVGAAGPRDGGFLLPPGAVRSGETWVDSTPLRSPSGGESRMRREFRLDRVEPRGAAGTAVVTMAATRCLDLPGGTVVVPSLGVARFDIAAQRLTGFAITTIATVPTPGGEITTRSEAVLREEGDSALAPPLLRRTRSAAPPAPLPPRPGPEMIEDSEPPGVELSPEPARFTVIRLAATDGQLNALLAEQVRRARAAGRHAFAEFDAAWCGPCRALKRHLGDPQMVEAFAGTWIVKVNLDRWQARLAGTGFEEVNAIPVFFELGDDGRPTGRQLGGGAWDEDVPEKMAPPLRAFFRRRGR